MVACQEDQARLEGSQGMSGAADHFAGTTPVRAGFEIDADALGHWMADQVDGFAGPLTIDQFRGGQSNPTYRLTTPGRRYVLRRKPMGMLLKGAHAVEREARVLSALERAAIPVPHVFALCTDDKVIGSWFYIMDMVEGRIFWEAAVPGVSTQERAAIFDSMNETMARLHNVDPAAIGLGDYGKTDRYIERQLARWSRQYVDDPDAGRDPSMDRLIAWLEDNIPTAAGTAVVHGDYRIDNLIFHPTEPRVVAILDWELSTLGHPLADFANHAIFYHMPPHIVAGLAGVKGVPDGVPVEADYVAAYCRRTGRAGIPDYDFYLAFSFFRMAAIFHGIRGRALRGTAASAQAAERGEHFFELAQIGARMAGVA